jgi:hypothetical protein
MYRIAMDLDLICRISSYSPNFLSSEDAEAEGKPAWSKICKQS